MPSGKVTSWDETKRDLNIAKHGYDLATLDDLFDGRFVLTREDLRKDYGEQRYNILVELKGRILNVTFTRAWNDFV